MIYPRFQVPLLCISGWVHFCAGAADTFSNVAVPVQRTPFQMLLSDYDFCGGGAAPATRV